MKRLMNDGWEFLKLPSGSTLEEACASESWENVDLPHDWLIWQHHDLYENADVWYRRMITFEKMPETCIISFDGVYMDCDVLLNGKIIRSHAYGYTAFYADMSGLVETGRNSVMVHIRHKSPNSRWYSGSGIFRDVHLLELPQDHIVPDSFYLIEKPDEYGWCLNVSAETAGKDSVPFLCSIADSSGKVIAEAETKSKNSRVELTIHLSDVKHWDPDDPVLYSLLYHYGEEKGEKRFGLRTTEFSPEKGFFLNHRHLKLKGVCLHHDLGALGAAFHEKAARRQLMLMKDMGANALRTSHNPPASRLLDLCDELGILVIDEFLDMWERPKTEFDYARFFGRDEEEDVALWIRRDRCHPSVILWSIGNEIYDMHADYRGTEVCTMLMNQVRSHDPFMHAAVTFGCNYMPWEGGQRCADIVKIAGYNYGEHLYNDHHRKHPDWVIYGSETASVLSSRGIYHFPIEMSIMSDVDLQCSALGNSNTSWGADDLGKMIIHDLKCSFSMGQFIWSGIDYIGEPTPYHTRSCYFGQADTACYPKDSYYLFQSMWSKERVLHIGVNWDWNPGQLIDVPVMTNFQRVELLLNGRSHGIKTVRSDVPEDCLPVWKIPFESGKLCARALNDKGDILCEDVRYTPGDTDKLVLTSENESLQSDGNDIAFITVQAVDASGHPVENARDRICITTAGGGYLIGTDNGDSTDNDGYKQSNRRLFNGKLLLIIASSGLREDVVITVRSSGGLSSALKLPVTEAEKIKGKSCVMRIPDSSACNGYVPLRKIEIIPLENRKLTKEKPSCMFKYRLLPEGACGEPIQWQVTNRSGIITPFADVYISGSNVHVTARRDGAYYLRALGGNTADHYEIISQIEFSAEGIGESSLNPYDFISAGLYDLQDGKIGSGNEKGVAFSNEGESMIGFTNIDFGSSGSDTLRLPVFALDSQPYKIMLYDGDPRSEGQLLSVLHYEKPSVWNQYQEETYHLPVLLTGIHTICFKMQKKIHLKGFVFIQKSRAFTRHYAGEADSVYGDSFKREKRSIKEIGNNVSIVFENMDFGEAKECSLALCGSTALQTNTISIHVKGENGELFYNIADFLGNGAYEQLFHILLPGGICTVTFVFLPGSSFDFDSFRFIQR